jgi:hypothetical protein
MFLGKDTSLEVLVDDEATDRGECIRVSGLMEIGNGSTVKASSKKSHAIECFGSIEANNAADISAVSDKKDSDVFCSGAVVNYGAEIDAEIAALEEAAQQSAEETSAETTEGDTSADMPEDTESTSENTGEDTDLGSLDALESFSTHAGDLLTEDHELAIDTSMILTEDDLPSPEDLDEYKDFSENV